MKKYTIYGIYDKTIDKIVYVGCTSDFKTRKSQYKSKIKKQIYETKIISYMIKKGFENFSFNIIREYNSNRKFAEIAEAYYIKKYDTFNNGYNVVAFGSAIFRKGFKHSLETRQQMSRKRFGKKHSEQTKKKISNGNKGKKNGMYGKIGKNNPNYGKKRSEETKLKLSKINSGKKQSIKIIQKRIVKIIKKIICLNDNEIFNSIKETSEYYNLEASSITKVCKNKQSHTKGYKFEYYKNFIGDIYKFYKSI